MKVVISGSRSITDYEIVRLALEQCGFEITELISGHCGPTKVGEAWKDNVDRLAERWAKTNKIPITLFPADWEKYGKSAGFKRNQQMLAIADTAVIVWDGQSKGTKHVIDGIKKLNKPYFVFDTSKES